MKKYNISVNGQTYEVEVEEVSSTGVSTSAPKVQSAPAEKTTSTPAPKAAKATATGETGSETIVAPMPGTMLDVKVSVGQEVSQGDVLCVLEAMKMENDIVAPRDGKVASVNAPKGASVNAGDVLVSLE